MTNTITLEITEEMAIRIRQAMSRKAIENLTNAYDCENREDSYLYEHYMNEREIAHTIVDLINEQLNN